MVQIKLVLRQKFHLHYRLLIKSASEKIKIKQLLH